MAQSQPSTRTRDSKLEQGLILRLRTSPDLATIMQIPTKWKLGHKPQLSFPSPRLLGLGRLLMMKMSQDQDSIDTSIQILQAKQCHSLKRERINSTLLSLRALAHMEVLMTGLLVMAMKGKLHLHFITYNTHLKLKVTQNYGLCFSNWFLFVLVVFTLKIGWRWCWFSIAAMPLSMCM